jgi:Tol biopolymer transport system component
MIEISHTQARRLIRAGMDDRVNGGALPEVQWSALQGHLEGCEACRVYQQRLDLLEKDLRRALLAGWSPVQGPDSQTDQAVSALLGQRSLQRRRVWQAAVGLMSIMLIIFLGFLVRERERFGLVPVFDTAVVEQGFLEPNFEEPLAVLLPTPTFLPTAQPGEFSDIIAYQTFKDGNSEIYLLNPGSESENFTNHPAHDSQPAWSPNGEWIAFLSDRTGKPEVFVSSISGRRTVQLSDEPGVEWQGPLSWSYDGKWIALSGLRTREGGQSWIYLLAVSDADRRPVALEGSRGGWAPEFSPYGGRVAFATWDEDRAGIVVLDPDTGRRITASWPGGGEERFRSGISLDWSADGGGLAYIAGSQAGGGGDSLEPLLQSQVVAIREMNYSASLYLDYPYNTRIAESRWPVAFKSVTWNQGGSVIYLEDLDDARANDSPGTTPGACWTLQLRSPGGSTQDDLAVLPNDLCVESGLDRKSWTPDGRWLVMRARRPGETDQALYAVRIPGRVFGRQGTAQSALDEQPPGTILRLTGSDHPFEQWAVSASAGSETQNILPMGSLPQVRPRLRFFRQPLQIDPQPVRVNRTQTAPADPTAAPGKIVFAREQNGISTLVSANPDGTGEFVLTTSAGKDRCPRWSPDSSRVAFVSDRARFLEGADAASGEALYLIDARGANLTAIPGTSADAGRGLLSYFGCPVWSPDGGWLAAITGTGMRSYVVILPLDDQNGAAEPSWMEIGTPLNGPAWTHDGKQVVLAHQPLPGQLAQILVVDLPSDDGVPSALHESRSIFHRGEIRGLVMSPHNWQAEVLSSLSGRSSQLQTAILRQVNLAGDDVRDPVRVGTNYPGARGVEGALVWLEDDSIGVILNGTPAQKYKTYIRRYDNERRIMNTLAEIEDRLYSAAWLPGGEWLIYSTESGLWLIDVRAALSHQSAPIWISPEPVYDLDWR